MSIWVGTNDIDFKSIKELTIPGPLEFHYIIVSYPWLLFPTWTLLKVNFDA